MSTPIICATHPDCNCNAPSANTLGNHKCCTCKRFAHGVFCIKPVDDPSLSDIQHYFNQYESEGMTKEVCLLCIKKICGNPLAPPPACRCPPPQQEPSTWSFICQKLFENFSENFQKIFRNFRKLSKTFENLRWLLRKWKFLITTKKG